MPRLTLSPCHRITVSLLCALAAGSGGALADCIPQWDNAIGQPGFNNEHAVRDFAVYQGELYAVGDFSLPSSAGDYVARWDGSLWKPVGTGFGVKGEQWCCNLYALEVFDGHLYAGGIFKSADGKPANSIARWDGQEWEPLGADGAGVIWSSINVGGVEAMTVFDDGTGPALYIGGFFDNADGQHAVSIVRFDGENFTPLDGPGSGVGGTSPFPRVRSLGVFDDGNGPALYAGGNFITAVPGTGEPITVNRIAKWDGQQWHALSNTGATVGANNLVLAFETFNDELYIGGAFSNVGGASASRIARFNGTTFSNVGSGVTAGESTTVLALQTYDDGTDSGGGPALYAAGFFTGMGGLPNVGHIARWDGQWWSRLGNGVVHTDIFIAARINGLAVYEDPSPGSESGPHLIVGGLFDRAVQPAGGQVAANGVVAWGGCAAEPTPPPPCPADLTGSGSVGVPDLLELLSCWGSVTPGSDCEAADLTGSGSVAVPDLLELLSQWGPCPQ